MHISQLYLSTYMPTELIKGQLQVTHEGVTLTIELSEHDREAIQNICVAAFLADRRKIADVIANNSPALVALAPPADDQADDAEFEPLSDEVPF